MTRSQQSPETILPDNLFEVFQLTESPPIPHVTGDDIVSLGFDNDNSGMFVLRVLNAALADGRLSQEAIRESEHTEKYELPGCAALACIAYLFSLTDRKTNPLTESDGFMRILEGLPHEQQQAIRELTGEEEPQAQALFSGFDPNNPTPLEQRDSSRGVSSSSSEHIVDEESAIFPGLNNDRLNKKT